MGSRTWKVLTSTVLVRRRCLLQTLCVELSGHYGGVSPVSVERSQKIRLFWSFSFVCESRTGFPLVYSVNILPSHTGICVFGHLDLF